MLVSSCVMNRESWAWGPYDPSITWVLSTPCRRDIKLYEPCVSTTVHRWLGHRISNADRVRKLCCNLPMVESWGWMSPVVKQLRQSRVATILPCSDATNNTPLFIVTGYESTSGIWTFRIDLNKHCAVERVDWCSSAGSSQVPSQRFTTTVLILWPYVDTTTLTANTQALHGHHEYGSVKVHCTIPWLQLSSNKFVPFSQQVWDVLPTDCIIPHPVNLKRTCT